MDVPVLLVPARSARARRARWAGGALLVATLAAGLGAQPAAASGAESVTGSVVRAWAEGEGGDDPELLTWIDSGEMVAVPTEPLEDVAEGATVTVQLGRPAGDVRPVLAAEVVAEPPSEHTDDAEAGDGLAAAGTTSHSVSVVMAVPAGGTRDATTLSAVVDAVNGPVSGFWSEQTGGRVSYSVDRTRDWVSLKAPCSDPWALWSQAAAAVGFVEGPGKHLLVYVTSTPGSLSGCYSGFGTVGEGITDGGYAYVRTNSVSLIAHELGHNLGLGHSDGLLCTGAADGAYGGGTWAGGCHQHGYRDWYDVMGISWSRLGTLSAAHAHHLGVLGSGVQATSTPVRATLAPVSGLAGLRALRVNDPGGGTYFVEYRPSTGRDAYISSVSQRVQAGVLVRRAIDSNRSVLLDGTPTGSTEDWAQALPPGRTLTTGSGRVGIRVDEVTSAGASISVIVDGVAPVTTPPPAPAPAPSPSPSPAPAPAPAPSPSPTAEDLRAPSFQDVPASAYFFDAVTWSARQGITTGTSAGTFAPADVVTRAQAVSFLWRSQGEPAAAAAGARFRDVPADAYFEDAVTWASSAGVTSGTSQLVFSPRQTLTREQAVTFLWRMVGEPDPAGRAGFRDVPAGSYSADAIAWAKERGITSGTTSTSFSPQGPVTRAQIVTFLHRLLAA